MKKLTVLIFVFCCTIYALAQSPRFDAYSQMGFNLGYAFGKENLKIKTGPTLGIVHSSVISHLIMLDSSASRLTMMYEENNNKGKFDAMELLMFDFGFGVPFIDNRFYIGFSPFSINWTKSGDYGLSVLGKAIVTDNIVIEGKIIPISYLKKYTNGESTMLENNTYLGLHYWFEEFFSLGLRYNRYGSFSNISLFISWNLFEI